MADPTTPRALMAVALATLAVLALACSEPAPPTPTAPPVSLRSTPTPTPPPVPPDPWENVVQVGGFEGPLVQLVPKDSIPAVFDPVMRPAEWADDLIPTERAPEPRIDPAQQMIGVSINGEHRAYPLRVMNAHELANDMLGGEPISLVY